MSLSWLHDRVGLLAQLHVKAGRLAMLYSQLWALAGIYTHLCSCRVTSCVPWKAGASNWTP